MTLGDVSITIQDTRLGSLSSTVHATLVQGGRERVVGYLTYAFVYKSWKDELLSESR